MYALYQGPMAHTANVCLTLGEVIRRKEVPEDQSVIFGLYDSWIDLR